MNNMKIEDIIESLNRHIDDKRKELNIDSKGHLVLQKTLSPHNTLKALKVCKNTVWYVKGKNKYIVLNITHTSRVLEGHEESIFRYVDMELCKMIFNWIGSNFYTQIIKDEYVGYGI